MIEYSKSDGVCTLRSDNPPINAIGFELPEEFVAALDQKNAEEIGYVTFAYEDSVPFKRDCFLHFVETLPVKLYRLKGFVLIEDKFVLINHVGGRTEWVELDKKGSTRLTFVGWQVSKDQVLEDLKVCLKRDYT